MADPTTASLARAAMGFLPRLLDRSRARRCVTILMYHGIVRAQPPVSDWCLLPEAKFVQQMEYVKDHFDVLPLREAVHRLRRSAINRPAAVLTFDDGFRSVHDLAFPVLRRLGLPATVFLSTGFVGTDDTIWFCRVLRALAGTQRQVLLWRGERYRLHSPAVKRAVSVRLQDRLKQLPQDDLLHEVGVIESVLGGPSGALRRRDDHLRILDPRSIRQMAASGLVDFGAHTETHAILTRVNRDRARREIEASIRATEELTGQPCDLFSYPNGTVRDYDAHTLATLHELGVTAAVTTIPGLNANGTSPLELRRDGIGGSHGFVKFQANLHHARDHLHIRAAH